ncbi:MAG: hypothetical protein RLZZ453_1047 [Chlamydiota bacterium]
MTIGLFALFSLLIVQFFKLQVIEADKWKAQAKKQHQLVVVEPFKRGVFYSNTSLKKGHPETCQPFVTDRPFFHLYADPGAILTPCKEEVARHLEGLLGKKEGEWVAQLQKKSRSRKLAMWLSKEEVDSIEKWWYPYAKSHHLPRNALFFIKDYKRSYPFGKLLGQVLHTVRDDRDQKTHQLIPTGGLEMVFDKLLQGRDGKRRILRSPRHSLEAGEILSYPEDGADVYLTINHYLQAVSEEVIAKAVQKANAKAGWAVMMQPDTGEIWALAQYPPFDPTDYRSYFNSPEKVEQTKVKAITDPFEPGSTMKPLTLVLALKANAELERQGKPPLFSPEEKIATANGAFPGRSKPIRDTRVHHYLNMNLALQKSSNIYMARLVQRIIDRLGEKWYRNALQEVFGFGVKTGIELPSESPGILPMPGRLHKNGKKEWSTPTPFSIAFGHNILTNSMQMIRAYGVLANGGYDVHPTLVRKIVKKTHNGEEILLNHIQPKERKCLVEKEIVERVRFAMRAVTKPGGCAPKADIMGYTEAGKTGTSEKIVGGTYSKKDHISTFIGFAPIKDPQFVLMVVVDEPEWKYVPGMGRNQMGGNCCGPAFAEIGLKTLEYLGVEPDDPFGYPAGDPRRDAAKADFAEDLKALKELYTQWNQFR